MLSEDAQIIARLAVALLIGCCLGMNRDLHGNPAGLRTHGLVSLGAALAALLCAARPGDPNLIDTNAVSRVLQGVLTGIGFIGAGVILRDDRGHVTGLTTAATIWLCAVLGAACGLGHWIVVIGTVALTATVLTLGGPVERRLERLFQRKPPNSR